MKYQGKDITIRRIQNRIRLYGRWAWHRFLEHTVGKRISDPKQIPIIINNFNQLTYLKCLINRLERAGYRNIHIIDNHSSFPPLLEYYGQCPYTVYRLEENIGFQALWKTGIFEKFKRSYYVYTDPDVLPVDECPDDFIEHFLAIMKQHKRAEKVGFSLRIDDLPDCYLQREQVIAHERQFWAKEIGTGLYRAAIDTTFALYRPFARDKSNRIECNIRTGYPYTARHLPWYSDSRNLTDEQKYYVSHIRGGGTMWSEKQRESTT